VTATRPATAALAIAVGVCVAGCSAAPRDSAASSPPATSRAPSSGASSSSTDPTDEAKSQAVALIPTYLRTIDDLYLDAMRPVDDIYDVAVAPEATAEATAIGAFRSQGYRQVGRSELVTASASSVDLTDDPAASPAPSLPRVVVIACVDVSQVQAIDASGASVVAPDRARYLIQRLTVVNTNYPEASSWRVSAAPNTQAQSCDG
jgi:hypothetical protein